MERTQGLLAIHLAVLLFGVAGLFGKLLHTTPTVIVFGRTLFAALALAIVVPALRIKVRLIHLKDLLAFAAMGAILAVHWVTFFHSIQISTVAIGLLTFSTFPIFVTFLEPVLFKEQLRRVDILISMAVFAGLALIIPEFDLANNLTLGAIWGTLSGLTFAVLSLMNRKFVARYPALTIVLFQDGIACILLLPFAGTQALALNLTELGLLVLLGVVFTALAHTLFIRGMLAVRAQLASVIACLEPVYGVLLALLLLGEVPSTRELLGGVIIISAILSATRLAAGAGKQGS